MTITKVPTKLDDTGYTPAFKDQRNPMTAHDERALDEVRLITQMMREHQAQIAALSKKRAAKVMKLREHKVTYREIAQAMGTTEQSVYLIIRGSK